MRMKEGRRVSITKYHSTTQTAPFHATTGETPFVGPELDIEEIDLEEEINTDYDEFYDELQSEDDELMNSLGQGPNTPL